MENSLRFLPEKCSLAGGVMLHLGHSHRGGGNERGNKMKTTRSQWKRVMPGWYVSRQNPAVEVKTYCDCNRSNCIMKWAVYLNDEVWNSSYSWSRTEATRDAEALLTEVTA